MTAREVRIDGDARAKVREPDSVLLLTLITLGIYNWYWYYRINCEMRDYGRSQGDEELASSRPGLSLLAVTLGALALVPPFVSWWRCAQRLERTQQLCGGPLTSFRLIMVFMFSGVVIPPLWLVNTFLVQGGLNEVWAGQPRVGHAAGLVESAPGAEVGLALTPPSRGDMGSTLGQGSGPARALASGGMSHFPGVDRQEAIVRAWPHVYGQSILATYPLTVVDRTLIVLCQTEDLRRQIEAESWRLIERLNTALTDHEDLLNAEGVIATRTEIYLAQELLSLKLWLRDFDLGF